MAFQEGDNLRFIWNRNGRDIADTMNKRVEIDFLQLNEVGGTFNLDEINCDVYLWDLQTNRYKLIDNDRELDGLVTVGGYECNDGIDNDGDTKIDSQDLGCTDRTDNSEQEHPRLILQRFCNEHPNNFFCLKMGLSDIVSLCREFSTSPLCVGEEINPDNLQNMCALDATICNGVNDIATYCGDVFDNGNDAIICNFVLQITSSCEEENSCFELNDDDKRNLCKVDGSYEFCNHFPADLGELCRNRECKAGLLCNPNKICETAFCDEGDTRDFECQNGIEIEQKCEDNEWIGECPRNTECKSGKTKQIFCSDGTEITQTCKNFKWKGTCPTIQQAAEVPIQRSQNNQVIQTQPQIEKETPITKQKTQWPLIVFILILAAVLAALAFYFPSRKQKSKKR